MKFIVLMGPPAVGKMTVGIILSKITGFKLFHNHMTIDLLLNFFEFGSPKFNKLNNEFRRRIFEEAASSDLSGLIFTYVTAMNLETEKAYLQKINDIFKNSSGEIFFIELESSLEVRIKRNKSAFRLRMKPSKRNVKISEKNLREMEEIYVMNSSENNPFFIQENYLKINNNDLSAKEVANQINQFLLKSN